MNEKNSLLAESLIPKTYVQQALQARNQQDHLLTVLLSQKRMPEEGWDDLSIEYALQTFAIMDSNNFAENVGVGEREGRIVSDIVARRHFRMAHGVGRSGDLAEVQPKAAGSSLMNKLAHSLVMDAFKIAGVQKLKKCLIVPLATGMTMAITLLTMKKRRGSTATHVIWPRIDQKSCLKCIVTANLTPVPVEGRLVGDEIQTDVEAIEREINERGPDTIVCIFSTASCFAPRAPDKMIEISQLSQKYNIPYVINNAYGLQCSVTCHIISEAIRIGRVDAIIQSSDKNFMVPVGGSIITSPDGDTVDAIAQNYPGRASGVAMSDLFITLLSMGRNGYAKLLSERKKNHQYFQEKMAEVAKACGERLLLTKNNHISFGMTLNTFKNEKGISFLGSMLFARCISGARVVVPELSGEISTTPQNSTSSQVPTTLSPLNPPTDPSTPSLDKETVQQSSHPKPQSINQTTKTVAGLSFRSYGAHIDVYHSPYMTVATAIGLTQDEIDVFTKRLMKTITDYRNP